MSRRLVVTAHGFRRVGPSVPTHVREDAFFAWADACRQRSGGFGDASEWLRDIAQEDETPATIASPAQPPILTFDDALASIDHVADRIPVPAILFVVVDHVGRLDDWPSQPTWVPRESCLSWSRIRSLAESGWLIGAHTMNHPFLSRLTPGEQRDQIERSKNTIEDRIGTACTLFAYPYGDAPVAARAIVERTGMIGFGTNPGVTNPRSNRVCLPRVDLFDLVRPGIAANWAWSHPGRADLIALRLKRTLGRMLPRRRAA